jgi:hypothetical protein
MYASPEPHVKGQALSTLFQAEVLLDRNSQACFHQLMVSAGLKALFVHGFAHALRPNTC